MRELLYLNKILDMNRYFIDIFKNSQAGIISLARDIFIIAITVALLFKYSLKRRYSIKYIVMAAWAYYVSSILHITLLSREYRDEVWEKINQGWGFESEKDYFQAVENGIMLFPVVFLLLLGVGKIFIKKATFMNTIFMSFIVSVICSMSIELLQVQFGLGTFQYADLVYNTMGGTVGGILYFIIDKIRDRLDKLLDY